MFETYFANLFNLVLHEMYEMSGFIFVPFVRVRNVGFLTIVRNVICTNFRGAPFQVAAIFLRQLLKKNFKNIFFHSHTKTTKFFSQRFNNHTCCDLQNFSVIVSE